MRKAALLFAGASLAGCATLPPSQSGVELSVIDTLIDAQATGHEYIYRQPPEVLDKNDSGRAAQAWSMLGREDKAALVDDEYSVAACPASEPMASGEAEVLTRIVEAARQHRVVIINESHQVTRHRDFSRQIIAALRPLDFSVLAAETFSNWNDDRPDPVELYAETPYIESRLGYYSKEPVFGAMLREAKALGYRFAAYEQVYVAGRDQPDDWRISVRDREIEQAANLAALIDSLGPDENLIVHVGYAHAREANVIDEDGWDHSWMAARLKRDHGIDPLTIAQTICRGSTDVSRIALESDDQAGWFDLIVDHPVAQFRFGKPAWRFADGRRAVPVPPQLQPVERPLVIEAFREGEPYDAVPADRVWVEPGEDIRLSLEPGSYTVRAVLPAPPRTD